MDEETRIIYDKIRQVAKDEDCVYYGDIAPLIDVSPHSTEMNCVLERISTHEHDAGHPLLTAVVILKEHNKPGAGFFKLAVKLGLYEGGDEIADLVYWTKELNRVHDYWRGR